MASKTNAASALLWIAQVVLAALFLFAGVVKLAMPLDPVAQMTGLPVTFLRFIAVVELLGALGLVLPGALHVRPALTPLAAIGLVGVMTGATILTAATQGMTPALLPAVVGTLLVTVVRGRRAWVGRPSPAAPASPSARPGGISKRAA
jgi:uncharacterized membrane protein YphA (DoxX/SURF4 family)